MTEARITPIRPFDPGNYSEYSPMQVGEASIYLSNADAEYASGRIDHAEASRRRAAALGELSPADRNHPLVLEANRRFTAIAQRRAHAAAGARVDRGREQAAPSGAARLARALPRMAAGANRGPGQIDALASTLLGSDREVLAMARSMRPADLSRVVAETIPEPGVRAEVEAAVRDRIAGAFDAALTRAVQDELRGLSRALSRPTDGMIERGLSELGEAGADVTLRELRGLGVDCDIVDAIEARSPVRSDADRDAVRPLLRQAYRRASTGVDAVREELARGGVRSQRAHAALTEMHPYLAARLAQSLGMRPEAALGESPRATPETLLEEAVSVSVRTGRRAAHESRELHGDVAKALHLGAMLVPVPGVSEAVTAMMIGVELHHASHERRDRAAARMAGTGTNEAAEIADAELSAAVDRALVTTIAARYGHGAEVVNVVAADRVITRDPIATGRGALVEPEVARD